MALLLATFFLRKGESVAGVKNEILTDTFSVTSIRQEARTGDRLSHVPAREFINFVPHAPHVTLNGQIVSVYG